MSLEPRSVSLPVVSYLRGATVFAYNSLANGFAIPGPVQVWLSAPFGHFYYRRYHTGMGILLPPHPGGADVTKNGLLSGGVHSAAGAGACRECAIAAIAAAAHRRARHRGGGGIVFLYCYIRVR
jgi:hypothetical protein